jgi:hypothetical protein
MLKHFNLLVAAGKVGGWMDGLTPESATGGDLEIEEAEDVSKDPSIGPATPMTPSAPRPKGLKS